MRDIRTMNMTEGQKIESDTVMKRIGDLAYRNLGSTMKAGMFDSGKALILDEGLRVEPSTGMTINLTSGNVFQRFVDVIPCIQTVAQTVTLDAASGSPRIDIIEAQIKKIEDKNDYAQTATVASGTAVAITNELIKRDIKYYLSARKQTNTTTTTAATAGTLTGTVAISGTIDLSEVYLLNLSDGEDGSYQEIDCRGATPEATTAGEIVANINAATGRVMASIGGGDVIVLTGNGTGETSYFQIKPPTTDADKDCLETIFGVSIGGVYRYTYQGTNEWFKLAEIDVGASTTTITASLIRNIEKKDTWASETDDILVHNKIYQPNLPEWNLYDSSITYGFGDVAWLDETQFVSIKASNIGNNPVITPDYWEIAPNFEDVLKDYHSAKPITPGIKNIDNFRDADYEQWNLMGYYKKNGNSYKAYKVRLDGTQITGDSDLENIFDVGGANEYFALDILAPDLGTRTLPDLRARFLRFVDSGTYTGAVGSVNTDSFKNHTHIVPGAANTVGTSFVSITATIDAGAGVTTGLSTDTSAAAETTPKNYVVGIPYIVVLLLV